MLLNKVLERIALLYSRDDTRDDDRNQSKRIRSDSQRPGSHGQSGRSGVLSSKDVNERPNEGIEEQLESLDDDEGFTEILGSLHLGAKSEDGHVGPEGETDVGHGADDVAESGIVIDNLPFDGYVVLDQHAGGLDAGPDDGDETGHGDTGDRDDGHRGQLAKVSLER